MLFQSNFNKWKEYDMPCSDSLALDRIEYNRRHASCDCHITIDQLKKNADAATRAACDMRTILRRHNLEQDLCSDTRRWIAKHDKDDKERIAVENANGLRAKAKQRGLNKLTLEERRALGL